MKSRPFAEQEQEALAALILTALVMCSSLGFVVLHVFAPKVFACSCCRDALQAAYVLEDFADKWAELSGLSRTEILFATGRVALVNAAMTLPVLKKVLFLGLKDDNLGVVDTARLIYNAFYAGIDTAKAFLGSATSAAPAADDNTDALLKELMLEFNTLAVVYEQPAHTFVDSSAHILRTVPTVVDDSLQEDRELAEGDFMEESAEAQLLDLSFGGEENEEEAGASLGGQVDGSLADLAGCEVDMLSAGTANGSASEGHGGVGLGLVGGAFDASAVINKESFAVEWASLEGGSVSSPISLAGDKAMLLMTQEPRPFATVHNALAGDHIKVRTGLCSCIRSRGL
jgi:hypothetical protein